MSFHKSRIINKEPGGWLLELIWNHSHSVSIMIGLRAGRPEFDSRQGQGFFLFATAPKQPLVSTQPPIKWVPGIFPWV